MSLDEILAEVREWGLTLGWGIFEKNGSEEIRLMLMYFADNGSVLFQITIDGDHQDIIPDMGIRELRWMVQNGVRCHFPTRVGLNEAITQLTMRVQDGEYQLVSNQ